jgi:dTMP kinase
LSGNIKLYLDPSCDGSTSSQETSTPADLREAADTEARMRKALGLDGTTLHLKLKPEQDRRPADRRAFGGHRRRFVQDGDVPVTVVRRAPAVEPGLSRLQQVEAQLVAETAARTQAERALAEAQSQIRDLRTKLAHTELTTNEALETARRDRGILAELKREMAQGATIRHQAEERLQKAEQQVSSLQGAITHERSAHKAADEALRRADEARKAAERLALELSASPPSSAPVSLPARGVSRGEADAPRRGRGRPAKAAAAKPNAVHFACSGS